MDEYKMIKAEAHYAKAIHKLIAEVLGGYKLYHLRPKYVDNDIDDLENVYFKNKGYFWVIINGAQHLIGSCAIFQLSNDTCELRKMYLEQSYQSKGIGKLLIDAAVTKAREIGYSNIILKTNSKLQKAIQVYKKYGFSEYVIAEADRKADCDIAMRMII